MNRARITINIEHKGIILSSLRTIKNPVASTVPSLLVAVHV